jgi:hypothetical protein
MQRRGAKSFVDDLVLSRGVVLSRAAASLRSIETKPFDWKICPLWTDIHLPTAENTWSSASGLYTRLLACLLARHGARAGERHVHFPHVGSTSGPACREVLFYFQSPASWLLGETARSSSNQPATAARQASRQASELAEGASPSRTRAGRQNAPPVQAGMHARRRLQVRLGRQAVLV